MRQYSQRLFRVARSILNDDADAENALQDAYVQACRKLGGGLRGQAELSTWLTRIVITEALRRVRQHRRDQNVVPTGERSADSPDLDVGLMIERRIDQMPAVFRTVFVMRNIEGMPAREAADCLGIPESTVRTRLFRARALLRDTLERDGVDAARGRVFGFDDACCDRIIAAVLARLSAA